MNRILKLVFLFLFVSTVSFVYAQDEVDDTKSGGKSLVKDNVKTGTGAKLDGTTNPGGGSKPTPARLAGHEEGKSAAVEKDHGKGKKGSFWQKIFGKKKVKKENPE
ncbi:MAG: hypothetical protein QF743_09050 [Candidatus Marinimicrobia bacterium]|jgi:hypothetical protein|nr:hypothetical protein [Candidatus Neomarinimicrobiota bacterium]MDP6611641.1 hypothetical protein [Candidatus Neomarinimicrobiota bacterium]|tara:strand:+ start:337 stop:654 length:318 start_codon:yes stop_codon:yes gene_type:complete